MKGFYVEVFAHKGFLIINPSEPVEHKKFFWPTGKGRMGCVLGDTLRHLRVSKEALALMEKIKTNGDVTGDLDWWWCTDETYAFSWWGAIYRVVNVAKSEAGRNFRVFPNLCKIIPNKVTKEMGDACRDGVYYWRTPIKV